jgi:8-oxo-dGTP diphosphatase
LPPFFGLGLPAGQRRDDTPPFPALPLKYNCLMRRTSELIPYRLINGQYYLFVQKRSADAALAPNMFGMFGGGIEAGETPEAALFREIREELDYEPRNVRVFRTYEFDDYELNIFLSNVDEHFESQIHVLEGEYGRFLNEPELMAANVSDMDRTVFNDVFRWLKETE